ncbi:hypothetical protein [Metabacillus arenae]|uniref:Uncharacterized protein n=1 Tax=Metabacillus arenae TaxID=2771434 RepID=A0A926RZ93_9BACI|nr:hypothetical protein [Metabacillus arenae]MBD1382580.1 hypothetical protein [Metabacillus arenae]
MEQLILALFLYFPEDKTEYIPAGITMVIFGIAAVIVFRLIVRASNKEEKKVEELYNNKDHNPEKNR